MRAVQLFANKYLHVRAFTNLKQTRPGLFKPTDFTLLHIQIMTHLYLMLNVHVCLLKRTGLELLASMSYEPTRKQLSKAMTSANTCTLGQLHNYIDSTRDNKHCKRFI